MERSDILSKINEVFIDTLDNEEIVIEEESHANDIEEWDSLSHILLVVATEKKFKVRFSAKEIQSWKNVGEMIDCIQEKL